LLKNPEHGKYFQYSVFSVYTLEGGPCNLGSIVCNLNQSRDWL